MSFERTSWAWRKNKIKNWTRHDFILFSKHEKSSWFLNFKKIENRNRWLWKKVNNCPTLILTHKLEDSSNGKNMFYFYLVG